MFRSLSFCRRFLLVAIFSCMLPYGYSQSSPRRLIVISVDGMLPADSYRPSDHNLKLPNLEKLIQRGCASPGVEAVFPSSTYPDHTTMVTGVLPAVHQIVSNTPLDPLGMESGGWYYYAEQIAVETLYQAADKAHLKTAAVSWPVTVGAKIDYLIPEYRPVMTREDREMMHVLSTPGMFEASEKAAAAYSPVMGDAWRTAAFIYILDTHNPDLMLLHLSGLDEMQHHYGPHSRESHAELERIDGYLGKILSAVQESNRAENTALMIVSDHGFMAYTKKINPMIALRDAGLIATDSNGRVTNWKVYMRRASGSAFFEAKDSEDTESIAKATAIIKDLAMNPANGISKVYTKSEINAKGADPEAFLAIGAARGFVIGAALNGALVTENPVAGAHGYDPLLPELHASMILAGSGVPLCTSLDNARMIDIAPTAAALLGIPMPHAQGVVLDQIHK
jgi:predicted AlkP superfamily pyrophosphatase or phosphodiesterase